MVSDVWCWRVPCCLFVVAARVGIVVCCVVVIVLCCVVVRWLFGWECVVVLCSVLCCCVARCVVVCVCGAMFRCSYCYVYCVCAVSCCDVLFRVVLDLCCFDCDVFVVCD